MNIQTLSTELAQRNIALFLDETGKLKCNGPANAITPALAQAIRDNRAALLVKLTRASTTTPVETIEEARASRSDTYRPCPNELTIWKAYYASCSWYEATNVDSPFALALEYACMNHDGSCVAISTNRLIRFYERCQHIDMHTEQGIAPIEPRQYTERLRAAYQTRNLQALSTLASNFCTPDVVSEVIRQANKLFSEQDAPERRALALDEQEQEQEIQRPAATPAAKKERALVVYVDIKSGRAITEAGAALAFSPNCTLAELVLAIKQDRTVHRLSIRMCGELPDNYTEWLTGAGIWTEYTTAKHGHYFDKEKAASNVARYQHRVTGEEVDIRTMYSWFADTEYTVEEAHAAMHLLNQYLQGTFTPDSKAYATPALTFQSLFQLMNRLQGKKFSLLPEDIRELIHSTSGQGRIELCTSEGLEKIPGLHYYDGVFMYSALTWSMPTELEVHDNLNMYAGKVPARYRIRYTVPTDWQHIGLFMTPKDKVTGNTRDKDAWAYPGKTYQGQTFETWADGSELDVLIQHYADYPANATSEDKRIAEKLGIERSFKAWDITILERIVFKSEKDATVKKPLDAITERLVKMREKVEEDMHQDASRLSIYKLVRGAIRNILLHGIGSFNRTNRDVTYILREEEPAPDGFTHQRTLENGTCMYTVPQRIEAYTQQFEHPEWPALIWARCRARMARAALSLPSECIIALRTDALAVTTKQPQWLASQKRGTLREKWSIQKTLKAPHSFEALDELVHKHVKGEN